MQKHNMKKVTQVGELTEGAVLADDVIDCSGRFLISKDTVIAASHIRVMKIWGIQEVVVYQTAKAVGADLSRRLPAKPSDSKGLPAKLQLTNLDNPFMQELVQHTILKR